MNDALELSPDRVVAFVKKRPNPIDTHVGSRIRMRRMMLGMSQEKLAASLSLTFQQVQKYEKGANRIGSSRLHLISEILDVPVSFFFEGVPSAVDAASANKSSQNMDYVTDFIATHEGLAMARAFCKIKDARLKRRLVALVEQLTS
jgi:transcriptional regulator with XRE-family HTH domain